MMDWNRTRGVIERGMAEGLHLGAQVAVWQHGELLADFALGEARPGVLLTNESVTPWMSAGKPLTALALAACSGGDARALDTPVAEWIPEFSAAGKAGVTLRDLLVHTGGFRPSDGVDERLPWDATLAAICETPLEADWVPGVTAGYHRNGSWFVLGEVAARMSGRPFPDAVRERVLAPLGLLDVWLGIPEADQEVLGGRLAGAFVSQRGVLTPSPVLNDPVVISRCRPGSGARGPIRELARLYAGLLRPPPGWLSAEVLRAWTSARRSGVFDKTFLAVVDMGLGFIRNSDSGAVRPMPYGYGPHASGETFGHSGAQSSCGFADPAHHLAVAWVCLGMPGEPAHQRRQRELNAAIYEDLGLA
jgi:CubicO group peptidase (beta-lactamase class C family)